MDHFEPFLCDSGGAKSVHNCRFGLFRVLASTSFQKLATCGAANRAQRSFIASNAWSCQAAKKDFKGPSSRLADFLVADDPQTIRGERSVQWHSEGATNSTGSIRLTSKIAYEKPMNDCKSSCSVPSERRLSIHLSWPSMGTESIVNFFINSSRGHSEKHHQKPLCELILLQSALDKNLRGPLFVKNQQELWSLFIQMRPFSCSKPGVAVFRQTRSSASHIRGWPAVQAPGTRCQRQLGRSKYTKGMQLPQSTD